ncbi:hypothetical protein [Pantoea sp. A4]|nr:hypothetical protein [Pantoea sp. A4]
MRIDANKPSSCSTIKKASLSGWLKSSHSAALLRQNLNLREKLFIEVFI